MIFSFFFRRVVALTAPHQCTKKKDEEGEVPEHHNIYILDLAIEYHGCNRARNPASKTVIHHASFPSRYLARIACSLATLEAPSRTIPMLNERGIRQWKATAHSLDLILT